MKKIRDEKGRVRELEEILRERKAVLADLWERPRCNSLVNGAYLCSLQVGHLGWCLAVFDDQPQDVEVPQESPRAHRPPATPNRANAAAGGRSHHLEHPGLWMGSAVRLALPAGVSSEAWDDQ